MGCMRNCGFCVCEVTLQPYLDSSDLSGISPVRDKYWKGSLPSVQIRQQTFPKAGGGGEEEDDVPQGPSERFPCFPQPTYRGSCAWGLVPARPRHAGTPIERRRRRVSASCRARAQRTRQYHTGRAPHKEGFRLSHPKP